MYATWCVMRAVEGGAVYGSPDCKTWLSFISRHTSGRDANDNIFGYDGDNISGYDLEVSKEVITKVNDANDCAIVLRPTPSFFIYKKGSSMY